MSKILTIIGFVISSCLVSANTVDIQQVRTLYYEGWIGECGANNVVRLLENNPALNQVLQAYYGASIATTANCKTWPLQKLSAFKEGKQILESALNSDTDNIEIRFIRFTIQSNIPSLLNYNNIEEDKKFILERLNLQASDGIDKDLMKRIVDYMLLSDKLTPEEKQNLQYLDVNKN